MHADLTLSASTLLAFALVLTRIVGVFIFVPLPVQDAGPAPARIIIALATALALLPRWPVLADKDLTLSTMTLWMISELALGTAIGLMVAFISESLAFGAQVLSLQAGYGYASVVDPTTQADSSVLSVVAQLISGLLFFTTGLHRQVISAFAASLDSYQPGSFTVNQDFAKTVVHLGSSIFTSGLRLALPIIGLLLMTDLSLGVLGRINSQVQMGGNAFPVKMLLTLLTLAVIVSVAPTLYEAFSSEVFRAIRTAFVH